MEVIREAITPKMTTKSVTRRRMAIRGFKPPGRPAPSPGPTPAPRPRRVKAKPQTNVFGPVTTIDTAPVSIGNSFQGAAPITIPIRDGMRVKGRDYLLRLDSTLQIYVDDWTLVGGAPITPACLIASAVKGFNNTYAQFMVHAVAFHFITSSNTAHDGNVMLYTAKDRKLPLPSTSNPNFMPFILSDHNTTMGPVWRNTSSIYVPDPVWRSTSPFDGESLHEQAAGEFFVFTKFNTNSTTIPASPGYILIDYDISFREMSLNIRNLTFPCSRMKYVQVGLTLTNPVLSNVVEFSTIGTFMDGSSSNSPTGWLLGDIYKVTLNLNNNGGITQPQNWFSVNVPIAGGANIQNVVANDGFTCYGIMNRTDAMVLFPNYPTANAEQTPLLWRTLAAGTYTTIAYVSLVGNAFNAGILQANF